MFFFIGLRENLESKSKDISVARVTDRVVWRNGPLVVVVVDDECLIIKKNMRFLLAETLSRISITVQDTYHFRHTFPCRNDSYNPRLKKKEHFAFFLSHKSLFSFYFILLFFLSHIMFSFTFISNFKIY